MKQAATVELLIASVRCCCLRIDLICIDRRFARTNCAAETDRCHREAANAILVMRIS